MTPRGTLRLQCHRGFTFVDLLVVITIIVILLSISIPIYNHTILRANESVLSNHLCGFIR